MIIHSPIAFVYSCLNCFICGFVLYAVKVLVFSFFNSLFIGIKKILITFEDIILLSIFSISLVIVVYYSDDGLFRLSYLIAFSLGFWISSLIFAKPLYFVTSSISELIIKIICKIIKLLRKICIFCFQPIAKLFNKMYNKVIKNKNREDQ